MVVSFREFDHSYSSINTDESINWTSVTSVISEFKEHFDSEKISKKCSKNKNSKWYGMKPEDIQQAWKAEAERATTLGTWYHNEREKDVLDCDTLTRSGCELKVFQPIEQDGLKIAPEQKLEAGIYPEHFIYLKSAAVCGQADRVEVVNNHIDLYDYKTNKEIKRESYVNWEGMSKKMKSPVSHLDDCNYWHYALQLSFYMYMMLKHNPKLKPGRLVLQHVIFEDDGEDGMGNKIHALDINNKPIIKEVVEYELPYLKDEVINIIKNRKK